MSFSEIFHKHAYTGLLHATTLERAIQIVESGMLKTPTTLPLKYPGAAFYPGKVFFVPTEDVLIKGPGVYFVFRLNLLDKFNFHLAPTGFWAGKRKAGDLSQDDLVAADDFLKAHPPPLGELVVYSDLPLEFCQKIVIPNSSLREEFLLALKSRGVKAINQKALDKFISSAE